jgi:hypothetical protein
MVVPYASTVCVLKKGYTVPTTKCVAVSSLSTYGSITSGKGSTKSGSSGYSIVKCGCCATKNCPKLRCEVPKAVSEISCAPDKYGSVKVLACLKTGKSACVYPFDNNIATCGACKKTSGKGKG